MKKAKLVHGSYVKSSVNKCGVPLMGNKTNPPKEKK